MKWPDRFDQHIGHIPKLRFNFYNMKFENKGKIMVRIVHKSPIATHSLPWLTEELYMWCSRCEGIKYEQNIKNI